MTKACVSLLPLYYAFNFIRCIKFKYCVFTTFKLYYLRRKNKPTTKCFPHKCSSFTVQIEINDMQPNPELVDQVEPLFCLCGLYQAVRVWLLEEESESTLLCSEVWCSTITGDLGLGWDHSSLSHCIIQTECSHAETGELTLGKALFELGHNLVLNSSRHIKNKMIMLWFTHCAAGERQPGCWNRSQGSVTPEMVQRKGSPGLCESMWSQEVLEAMNIKANKSTSIKLCKPIKCSSPGTGLVWWWKAREVCQGITDLFFQAAGTSTPIKTLRSWPLTYKSFSLERVSDNRHGQGVRRAKAKQL